MEKLVYNFYFVLISIIFIIKVISYFSLCKLIKQSSSSSSLILNNNINKTNINNDNNYNKFKIDYNLVEEEEIKLLCLMVIYLVSTIIYFIVNQFRVKYNGISIMGRTIVPVINKREIEYEGHLGSGNFGSVFKAKYRNFKVAVKSIRGHYESINEAKCQFLLSGHKNIVNMFGAFGLGRMGESASLVFELMECSLIDFINRNKNQLCNKPRSLFKIMYEISDGLKHMHNNGFIHGDLHYGNILVKGQVYSNDIFMPQLIKLSDFGLSKFEAVDWLENITNDIGALQFMSPEALLDGRKEFGKADDIYSFGILTWVIFGLSAGFNLNYSFDRVLTEGSAALDLNMVPIQIARIIQSCTSSKEKRPSIEKVQDQLINAEIEIFGKSHNYY